MSQRVHRRQTAEDVTTAHPRTLGDHVFLKKKKAKTLNPREKKRVNHARNMEEDDRDAKYQRTNWFRISHLRTLQGGAKYSDLQLSEGNREGGSQLVALEPVTCSTQSSQLCCSLVKF